MKHCDRNAARPALAALFLSLFPGAAAAQQAEPAPQAPEAPLDFESIIRGAAGVDVVEGEVVAGGPDYKAHFPPGRMVFTPALGRSAERNRPLTFAFEGLFRGDSQVVAATGDAAARVEGSFALIDHPGGLVERYQALTEGLHQTFVVPERPAGAGDLIVRGRIDTDLPLAGLESDGGLSFEQDEVGGVHLGGVTGVDANGATAPGELRLVGEDTLELVLPSSFVDAAAYPLVVDPLIGSVVAIDDNVWNDDNPDVAASNSSGSRFLVVWQRIFSIGDTDIRGYRLDDSGGYVGSLLFLENDDDVNSDTPTVAHVAVSERFFVAWTESVNIFSPFNLRGRAVDADNGSTSPAITIASSTSNQFAPDIGGERTIVDNDAYVVWVEQGFGIQGQQITVPVVGDPFPIGAVDLIADDFGGGFYQNPAISKSAGDVGRFMLAFENGDDILFRTITRNGDLEGGAILLGAVVGGPHAAPACDGDGTDFMMVWERGENFSLDSTDIYGMSVSFADGGLRVNSFEPVENNEDDDESQPDVAYTGGQYAVAYTDTDTTDNMYIKSIEPFSCLLCENEDVVSATSDTHQEASLTSYYSAGLPDSEVFLVWNAFNSDGNGDVLAHVYDSPKGQQSLGGECGGGGRALTPCPYSGNANFALQLRQAEQLTPAYVVLSFAQSPVGCGSCTLWPSLAAPQVFFAGITDQYGSLSLPVALPSGTTGVQFTTQWGVLSGTTCGLFDIDLSNGVQTEVQL
ncbi:MAG: hypothetical protein AAF682_01390 [Planctomycetota bacterium]